MLIPTWVESPLQDFEFEQIVNLPVLLVSLGIPFQHIVPFKKMALELGDSNEDWKQTEKEQGKGFNMSCCY